MRKLKRSVARHNMLRAGFTRLNKKGADGSTCKEGKGHEVE